MAFLLAFGESFVGLSLLVPGTALLIALGGLIGAQNGSIWFAAVGAAIGASLGDWISFRIGLHFQDRVENISKKGRLARLVVTGSHALRRFGDGAIFIGRFFGPLRASVPLAAGLSGLPEWRFQIANISSAVLWAYIVLALPAAASRYFS